MSTTTVATSPTRQPERPSLRQRARWWLVVGAAVLVAVLVATWAAQNDAEYSEPLDPQNPGPDGAQALAQVLGDEGVDVTIARSRSELHRADIDGRTTVVVTGSEMLAASTARDLLRETRKAQLVVVDPPYFLLEQLGSSLTTVSGEADEVTADCTSGYDGPDLEGLSLSVDTATGFDAGAGCFASGGTLLLADDGDTLFFGAGEALTNDQVLRDDNAAVALRLLGQDERLVWYVPSYDDAADDEVVSIWSFAPSWLQPALWLTTLAVLALAVWRFRRLGPLSREPLPVVVRAVETARSRGRLYRRGNDRAHAAGALRAAARRRLAARLRLGRGAESAAVVDAVAHLLDRPRDEIDALLGEHARAPATDAELVQLAQTLTRLMREVRRG